MRLVSPLCSNLRVARACCSFTGSMERGSASQQCHDWLEALGYPFPKLSPKQAVGSQAKRGERLAQYGQVVALRHQGFSQTAIASQVGIGHATASRWLSSNAFPEQKPRPRMTRLDPHLKEVAERWEAGCHNIAQLHRDLVAAGHTLTYKSVYKQLIRYLPERAEECGIS